MQADRLTLDAAGKEAIKRFRDSKPWRGDFTQRLEKFQTLHRELAAACAVEATFEFRGVEVSADVGGNGAYAADINAIILVGRLSAVTYLYCFAMMFGLSRSDAKRWAVELFRHYFPRSYRGCEVRDGMLVRRDG